MVWARLRRRARPAKVAAKSKGKQDVGGGGRGEERPTTGSDIASLLAWLLVEQRQDRGRQGRGERRW